MLYDFIRAHAARPRINTTHNVMLISFPEIRLGLEQVAASDFEASAERNVTESRGASNGTLSAA